MAAWLIEHNLPKVILSEELPEYYGQEVTRVYCLYFCPGRVINFLDQDEFDFLKRFERPTTIFDFDNPYSTETLTLARNWLGRCVLTGMEEPS